MFNRNQVTKGSIIYILGTSSVSIQEKVNSMSVKNFAKVLNIINENEVTIEKGEKMLNFKLYNYYYLTIENMTEEMQKIAVKLNPFEVAKIKNPKMSVIIEAVTTNGEVIKFIKNPNFKLKKIAVNQNPFIVTSMVFEPEFQLEALLKGVPIFAILNLETEVVMVDCLRRKYELDNEKSKECLNSILKFKR